MVLTFVVVDRWFKFHPCFPQMAIISLPLRAKKKVGWNKYKICNLEYWKIYMYYWECLLYLLIRTRDIWKIVVLAKNCLQGRVRKGKISPSKGCYVPSLNIHNDTVQQKRQSPFKGLQLFHQKLIIHVLRSMSIDASQMTWLVQHVGNCLPPPPIFCYEVLSIALDINSLYSDCKVILCM